MAGCKARWCCPMMAPSRVDGETDSDRAFDLRVGKRYGTVEEALMRMIPFPLEAPIILQTDRFFGGGEVGRGGETLEVRF